MGGGGWVGGHNEAGECASGGGPGGEKGIRGVSGSQVMLGGVAR